MKFLSLLMVLVIFPTFGDQKTVKVERKNLYEKKLFHGYATTDVIEHIKVEAKRWHDWRVEEAVNHGSEVKAGDVLVRFKSEKLATAVENKQRDLKLHELKIDQQKLALTSLEDEAERELELAALKAEIAQKAEMLYKATGRDRFIDGYKNDVADTEKNLKYQQAELAQLEKMYIEDSLAEESEEIVLQRQKDAVARAERFVKIRQIMMEEALALKLPMTDFSKVYNKERADREVDAAKLKWKVQIETEKIKLIKLKQSFDKSMKELDELIQEKESLTLKASIPGMVYLGSFKDGKWQSEAKDELREGDAIKVGSSFMTIVGGETERVKLLVHDRDRDLLEDQTKWVTTNLGQRCKAELLGNPGLALNAYHKALFKIPSGKASFGQKVTLQGIRQLKENVLSLPIKSLSYGDIEPDKAYVFLNDSGKKEKVFVELGEFTSEKVEILSGLKEGDSVFLP